MSNGLNLIKTMFATNFYRTIADNLRPTSVSIRFYGRWLHRNPAKIALPFEPTSKASLKKEKVIELNLDLKKSLKPVDAGTGVSSKENSEVKAQTVHHNAKRLKNEKDEKEKKRNFYLSQTKIFDDNNNFIYEKLNKNDGRINSLLVKLKSKKERQQSNQMLVEGWRLIVDGLEAKCKLRYIIFSQVEDLNNLRSFLPNTGVKIFKMPYKDMEIWSNVETTPGLFGVFEIPKAENIKVAKPLPLSFICDNIRIPGNLGAILRVAMGVGCDKVVLSKGCVDVFDPKVVRSAAGAHFRLPIHHSVDWEDMPHYLKENTSLFIADNNIKYSEEDSKADICDGVPVIPYYGIEYSTLNNITLIIGGETEGISHNSYSLAASHNGIRLNIPLRVGVDSLNTGMAAAVIAFEIRKQLIQEWTRKKLERQSQFNT